MTERRKITVQLLENKAWLLLLDLQFEAKEAVTLGKTPFGIIGVRMAKQLGVNDGHGKILNSDGKLNEKEVFWKPAKWVNYSGVTTVERALGDFEKVDEGITLMDHPSNPNHPSVFHVRNDGWMGASLTFGAARTIEPGKSLQLHYGLYMHGGQPGVKELEQRWAAFAKTAVTDLTPMKKK